MIGFMLLHWTLAFSADAGRTWTTQERDRAFLDPVEARIVYKHAPKDTFECESGFLGHGFCKVTEVHMEEIDANGQDQSQEVDETQGAPATQKGEKAARQ